MLLKAALLDGEEAITAFQHWRTTFDFEAVHYGEQRLLPLLQHNLTRLGVDDPLFDRFRGIRRYFWVRNLKSMTFARRIYSAFDQTGVPFIVLKGAALIACYLQDRSLRPMDDIDVLVPEDRLSDAIAALAEMNLHPRGTTAWHLVENQRVRSALPGWAFFGPNQNVDLHWRVLHFDLSPHADDQFWQAHRKAKIDGMEIAVLDPADQLLHIIAHAAQPTAGAASCTWPADAALVIRGSSVLCYERLVSVAARHNLSAIVSEGLTFLSQALNLPIPRSAISGLRAAESWPEQAEMRLLANGGGSSRRSTLLLALQSFKRNNAPDLGVARTLSAFLKSWTGVRDIGPACLLAAQSLVGGPAWTRRLLGHDCYRVPPDPKRLPKIGDTLDLRGTEIDETPLVSGWSIPEPTGRWTVGYEATIAWALNGDEQDLRLLVNGHAMLLRKAPTQLIELFANDRQVATWRFHKGEVSPLPASIHLPRKLIRDQAVLMLTFVIRNPVCPAHFGTEDARALGIHLSSVTVRADPTPPRSIPL